MPHHVLYISYNGIDEPLVHSQVLGYLAGLTTLGYRFTLLTFEREAMATVAMQDRRQGLAARGIDWHPVEAHRGLGPVSTALDVWAGWRKARRLVAQDRPRLVHARSFVPALIGRLLERTGVPLLYDMRGFWIDERVYRGRLRFAGPLYRIGKWLEAWIVEGSAAIVSLTQAGVRALQGFPSLRGRTLPPAHVIPTCADLELFAPGAGADGAFVVGYVGSMSDDYLPGVMLRFFAEVLRLQPAAELRLVSRSDPGRIWAAVEASGVPKQSVSLVRREPGEVPAEVRRFDLGLSLIKPGLAKLASCPTKVGEYLASGVPVICNAGIGDLDALVGANDVGIVLESLDDGAVRRAAARAVTWARSPGVAERCRAVAESEFSLSAGVRKYAAIYAALAATG